MYGMLALSKIRTHDPCDTDVALLPTEMKKKTQLLRTGQF